MAEILPTVAIPSSNCFLVAFLVSFVSASTITKRSSSVTLLNAGKLRSLILILDILFPIILLKFSLFQRHSITDPHLLDQLLEGC